MLDSLQLLLSTSDLDEARAALSTSYCPHSLRVLGRARGFQARHRADGFEGMSLHLLSYSCDVRAEADPLRDFILLSQVRRGRYRIASVEGERTLGPGETVTLDPNTAYCMDFLDDCEMLQLRIEYDAWYRAFVDLIGVDASWPVRFSITVPPRPSLEHRRSSILSLVAQFVMDQSWVAETQLLRIPLIQLCLATLLDTSAHEVSTLWPPHEVSKVVQRAIEYFNEHAQEEVGLTDVARAVYLSPRALQQTFKRELDISPLAALREIRLRGAHEDLRRNSPHEKTVTDIALIWGFANMGRFAKEYRRRFGRLPSETLRSRNRTRTPNVSRGLDSSSPCTSKQV